MNIYDIAKLAGVSIATVSRVVNNSPRVSERTKQKVLSVMRENDYTPNVFARGLGLDSMRTVGIICPDVSDAYMACSLSFLERRLRRYGYDCILSCSGFSEEKKEQAVSLLLKKRIDALILVGSAYAGSGDDDEAANYIRQAAQTVPVFLVNALVYGENIYSVYCEDFNAAYQAAASLIESGRSRILFLSDSHSYSAEQKLSGYEHALRDHGLPVLGPLKLYVKNQVAYVRDILLSRRDLAFDSVLATDDGLAIGAVKYAHARCLRIPEDLAVIGYNNLNLSVCCEPELTTIDSRAEKLCNQTVDNLMKLLEGKENIPSVVPVPARMVRRCTTDF